MSLSSVNTISAVQIDVTPSGGSTTSREYVARNVRVMKQINGKSRQLADDSIYTKVDSYHLIFEMGGSDIDQIDSGLRGPRDLQLDLEDPDGFTVELYPDADQTKKFEVVAFDLSDQQLASFVNMARTGSDRLLCKTIEAVTRTDIEWFKKYG